MFMHDIQTTFFCFSQAMINLPGPPYFIKFSGVLVHIDHNYNDIQNDHRIYSMVSLNRTNNTKCSIWVEEIK